MLQQAVGALMAVLATIATTATSDASEPPAVPEASFFGIVLGKPLTLPQCPSERLSAGAIYTGKTKTLCAMKNAPFPQDIGGLLIDVYFPFLKGPEFVNGGEIFVRVMEGKVWDISLATLGIAAQDDVLHQMTDKFGKPTAFDVEDLQNAFGAHFRAYSARWVFDDFDVRFDGSDGTIDAGEIEIRTSRYAAAVKAWDDHQKIGEPKL